MTHCLKVFHLIPLMLCFGSWLMIDSFFIFPAPPSLAHTQLGAWSPWEPSPLFFHQRQSLLTSPQVPSYLQRSSNNINNAKTTSQPIHHPSTTKLKSENVNSSHSEKSPTKRKLNKQHSVKSLIDGGTAEKDLIDDYKYLSNSLSCLDVAKL